MGAGQTCNLSLSTRINSPSARLRPSLDRQKPYVSAGRNSDQNGSTVPSLQSPGMSFERVSQKDIAAKAGVHITTVSLALRDSPRLPLGDARAYSPAGGRDGVLPRPDALGPHRVPQERQGLRYQGTLAWLNTIIRPETDNLGYKDGAIERCAELGYVLEELSRGRQSLPRISGPAGAQYRPASSSLRSRGDSLTSISIGKIFPRSPLATASPGPGFTS